MVLETIRGQGFVNLDFEDANVPPTPVDTWGDFVDPSLAFPGWTIPTGDPFFRVSTFYNDLSLGGPAVGLIGPDFPNRPGYDALDGSYSVLLQYFGIGDPPALSQTGLIPPGTQSISILEGNSTFGGGLVVALNGINIPIAGIGGGYVGGNITAFAGTTAQLTISTASPASVGSPDWAYFDDIEFSPSPVPEPSALSWFSICLFLFCKRLKRSNQAG